MYGCRCRRARGRGSRSTSCRSGRRSAPSAGRGGGRCCSARRSRSRGRTRGRRAEVDERLGQVRAHEPVGAGDEHRPAGVDLAELARQLASACSVQAESGAPICPRLASSAAENGLSELERLQPDLRREDALADGGDGALAGRQVREVHPVALPLAVDRLVGELADDGGAEADGGSICQAAELRQCSTTAATGGMYASSRSISPPVFTCGWRYHQSSVGYGKACAPSTRTKSSGRGCQLRQDVGRAPDPERQALGRDAAPLALGEDAVGLGLARRDGLVVGAARREDDRARARAGLERRHPGLHGALDEVERLPREAPELLLAVEGRRARSAARR